MTERQKNGNKKEGLKKNKSEKRKRERQDMRRSVSVKTRQTRRGSDGNVFHYKMGTDAHRLDTERAENNKQMRCFSQRSEESVFRFK